MAFTRACEPFHPLATTPAWEPEATPAAPALLERCLGAVRALGTFVRARSGSVPVESVISITLMTVLCGGLMAIAHTAHSQDRMDRAARAAARAIALLPQGAAMDEAAVNAVVCDVLRVEYDLNQKNDCSERWTISVVTDLGASDLTAEDKDIDDDPNNPQEQGEMILVRINSGHAVVRREPAG